MIAFKEENFDKTLEKLFFYPLGGFIGEFSFIACSEHDWIAQGLHEA